mgnify:CR=1 FL=1
MMFANSLTARVVVLCLVPLMFQLGLLGALENLRAQSEADLDRSIKSRAISDAINQLAHDIFDIESMYGHETALVQAAPTEADFKVQLARLHKDYDAIEALIGNDSRRMAIVQKSRNTADEALKLFTALRDSQEHRSADWKERESLWWKLRACAVNLMSEEMIEIGKSEKAQAARSPEVQREFRTKIRQLVFVGAGVNLLLAGLLALYLTRTIILRLKKINENAVRLANDLPLNPPTGGADELGALDASFHNMANALKESVRKEQAVTDNMRDCIFSIDGEGTIMRANPACSSMFKIENEDLVGRRFIDLIETSEIDTAYTFMLTQQEGAEPKNLDVTMKRRDGTTFDALWSARWSPDEKALYSIISDQSERIQAERLKQEVVAMVTHDLRVPLSVMQNFLQFIENGYYGNLNEKGLKFFPGTKRNCNQMLDLTNDLLDLEKIKSGMMELDLENTDLAEVVKQCVETLTPVAEEFGLKLEVTAEPLHMRVDSKLISRTVTNLVSNAMKHSPRDAKVQIELKQHDGVAQVSVRDFGTGIAKEEQEKIFERFHQASGSAKQITGTGLGLTICKLVVDMHGGKIWVESEKGKGSTFAFALPLES